MIEIRYNVVLEVDESSKKIVESAIDEGFEQGMRNAAKAIEEATGETVNFNKVLENNNKNLNENTDARQRNLDAIRLEVSELKESTATFRKNATQKGKDLKALKSHSEELAENSVIIQKRREELLDMMQTEELNEKQKKTIVDLLRQISTSQRSAISAVNSYDHALNQAIDSEGDMINQSGSMNKAFSGTNQLLFSFGDLVQDSTQFSQGFAQGMRAIGNNVGFTAELFGNLITNVERHNNLVAKGVLKNEEQITVQQALIKSLTGVGGVLIGINALVLATQFAFESLDKAIKEVTDSAASQAEALADVARSFSELDTGVDDPFGFRARATEIEILSQAVGGFEDADELLRAVFGGFGLPAGIVAKVASAFSDNAAAIYQNILTLENLDNKLREVTTTQEAYEDVINSQTSALSKYVALTSELELVNIEASTGIELTDQTLQSLSNETENQIRLLETQINLLRSRGESTTAEISSLIRLIKFQEQVNGLIDDNNKAQRERAENSAKIISDATKQRYLANQNAEFIRREIELLNETDEIKRVSLSADIERSKEALSFKMSQYELEESLIEAGLDAEQRATYMKAQLREHEANIAKITANEKIAIAEIEKNREIEIAKERADMLQRIRQQEINDRKFAYNESLNFIQSTISDEMMLMGLKRQNELAGEDEKTRALAEIDAKYQEKKNSLTKDGLWNKQIVEQLEIAQEKEKADAIADINEKEQKAKVKMAQDTLQVLSFVAQGLFKNQKVGAIANAVMNTYEAATKALTATPFLAVNKVLAGATIAAGMAQVKKIMNTNMDGSAPSGGMGGGTSTQSSFPQRGFFERDTSLNFNNRYMPFDPSMGQATIVLEGTLDEEVLSYKVKSGNAKIESGTNYLGE